VVGGSFQSIDHVYFYVNREKVDPELLFEVSLGLDGKDAGVCFLMEHVFEPLGSTTTFKECEGPEDFLLFVVELLWGQANVERVGVQKCTVVVTFSAEVQKIGELGTHLFRHWSGGRDTGGDGTSRGGMCGMGGRGELATSYVSCCNCMVKAASMVLMLFSEMFCLSVSS